MKKRLLLGAGVVLVSLFSFQSLKSNTYENNEVIIEEMDEDLTVSTESKADLSEDFTQMTD